MKKLIIACMSALTLSACATTSSEQYSYYTGQEEDKKPSTYKVEEENQNTMGKQFVYMLLTAIANTRHHRVNTPSGSYSIISNSSTTTITKIK